MKRFTKIYPPKDEEYIFTEGINYFETGKESIWGAGDTDTLKLLENADIHGKWLNLCAGDGRYNLNLLKKADSVVASDIDQSALSKLFENSPEEYQKKLSTRSFNVTNKFPFDNKSFDGVFCTGVLHLFPKIMLKHIFSEINRIVKNDGKIILDFATEVKRIGPDGKLIKFGNEPLYSLNEAKELLRSLMQGYNIKMQDSKVTEEFQSANPPYTLNCNFILLIADKQ